jgi:hypothetical protein
MFYIQNKILSFKTKTIIYIQKNLFSLKNPKKQKKILFFKKSPKTKKKKLFSLKNPKNKKKFFSLKNPKNKKKFFSLKNPKNEKKKLFSIYNIILHKIFFPTSCFYGYIPSKHYFFTLLQTSIFLTILPTRRLILQSLPIVFPLQKTTTL